MRLTKQARGRVFYFRVDGMRITVARKECSLNVTSEIDG